MTDMTSDIAKQVLDASLMHVPFDGWSQTAFDAAVADCDVNPVVARALFPRGAVDLAVAFHKRGDAQMQSYLAADNLSDMKIREKITHAVRTRLEVCPDREIIRRGTSLFSLPQHVPTGAELIWDTCDAIWTAIGDPSTDFNWYTKRATLSAVYSSTVLYWLGDESVDNSATWEFLDRRIENVMQFEKFKAQARSGPLGKLMAAPLAALSRVKAPEKRRDFPGQWRGPTT
ncbi:COQ9 family protein [Shimia abyssi]|uniref:Ubiquinone biosynthesis protein COQ9 n=1 Tax=Shimia abyssi TaxID=1662395 RepID=A0A2P8FAE2_9RHOB|nr:COQ9 family protein [Shimia abyssi]PSL18690.1 ubiquinone biosynthesis protein COQ9 [Shimia abyssi]